MGRLWIKEGAEVSALNHENERHEKTSENHEGEIKQEDHQSLFFQTAKTC